MTILGSFTADKKYDRCFANFQDITKICLLYLEDNSLNIFLFLWKFPLELYEIPVLLVNSF